MRAIRRFATFLLSALLGAVGPSFAQSGRSLAPLPEPLAPVAGIAGALPDASAPAGPAVSASALLPDSPARAAGLRALLSAGETDPAKSREADGASAGRALFDGSKRFSPSVQAVAEKLEAQFAAMDVELGGKDRDFFSLLRASAGENLDGIDGHLAAGRIDPTFEVRASASDEAAPERAERRRIGFYPVAADPFHWGHLLIGLQAVSRLAVDKVVFVMAGDDPRKPDMTPAAVRHPLGRAVLAAFSPFFVYSSIAVGTRFDGETNLFRFLRLNPSQKLEAFYLVGDDHYRLKDKKGNDDTLPKLEKNMKDPALGFDPSMHEVSAAFIEREGAGEEVPTPLGVRFLPKMGFEASSTKVRGGELSLTPYSVLEYVRRNRLDLYGIK